jgi:hypothetical protein
VMCPCFRSPCQSRWSTDPDTAVSGDSPAAARARRAPTRATMSSARLLRSDGL